jgi:hypothetical protein
MNKIFGFAAVALLSLTLIAGPSYAMGSADRDEGPAERAGESIDEAGRAARDAVTPRENEGVDLDVHSNPVTPRENEGIDIDVHGDDEQKGDRMLLADSGKGKYGSDDYDEGYKRSDKDYHKSGDYDRKHDSYDKRDYDKHDSYDKRDYDKHDSYDKRDYDKHDSYDKKDYDSDKSYKDY